MKTLLNIGHIIWYKIYMVCLHMIDVEIPIPSQFSVINNDNPNQNDIAKALGHMDKDNNYITDVNYEPYGMESTTRDEWGYPRTVRKVDKAVLDSILD